MQNRKCHSIFCKFPSQNGKKRPLHDTRWGNRQIEILCDDTISHTQIFSNSNTALGHKQKILPNYLQSDHSSERTTNHVWNCRIYWK